jgi:hypothetical protein
MTLQPCPNEECRLNSAHIAQDEQTDGTDWYQVECTACHTAGPRVEDFRDSAIRLWNALPRTEPWVSVAERMPELGMRCELIHSDPTEPVLVLTIAESEFAAYDHGFESLGTLSRGIYTHWRPYREPPRPPTP